jgi:genome maintenance exonuclease 1
MSSERKYCQFDANGKYTHDWLLDCDIEQVNTDKGRYYLIENKFKYPSVTTILGKRTNHELQEWKDSVGETEVKRIGNRASTRGTNLHHNVENYLLNHTVHIEKTRLLDISLMKSIVPVLHNISDIRLLESPLYSHSLKMAGTVDCVASYEGTPAIIDFKTTTKLKSKEDIDNYFIQTSIYSIMVNERYGLDINKLVILIAQEFGPCQVFIEQRRNWFKQLKEIINESKNYIFDW